MGVSLFLWPFDAINGPDKFIYLTSNLSVVGFLKRTICISLGGSMMFKGSDINIDYLKRFSEVISRFAKTNKFIIVIGGGHVSRMYIEAAKAFTKNNFLLDEMGMSVTKLNALFLINMFPKTLNVAQNVPVTLEELKTSLQAYDIVVMGGLMVGMTTDADAALACDAAGADTMINISNIDYIYDRPPEEKGARKLTRMTHEELIELATKYDTREARTHFVFDLVACKLAKRAKIELHFLGNDTGEFEKALAGKAHMGTVVK